MNKISFDMGPLENIQIPSTGAEYTVTVPTPRGSNFLQGLSQMGGLIGGLAGAVGNWIQARRDKSANTLNYLREQAMDARNLSLYFMNRDYNEPKNQMKRLIEAGINPNLAAGLVSGNTSQPFATAPASMASNPTAGVLGTQLRMLASQAREAYYDSRIKEEQWLSLREQRKLNAHKGVTAYLSNMFASESFDERLAALSLRNQLSEGQLTLLENKSAASAMARWFAEWFVKQPADKQEAFFRSQYAQTLLDTAIKASISDVKSTEADFYKYNNHPAWKALQFLSFLFKK